MLNRDQALILIKKYLQDKENIKKAYAAEAILKRMAEMLNKNEELWSLTGLLHNIDYEYTEGDPKERGNLSEKLLSNLLPKDGVNAIKADNYVHTDYVPVTSLDRVLIATVTFLGLFFYIKRNYPDKKTTDITLPFFYNKFNDPNFGQRFNRNRIKIITNIGLSVEDFLKISLDSLNEINKEIDF